MELDLATDFPDFVETGFFRSSNDEPRRLYEHQAEALRQYRAGRHIVIATGTGSGKTEAFLLPILSTLLRESACWPDTGKEPAIRALLLYPLNALVEDQMIRLRRGLNGDSLGKDPKTPRSWLRDHRADKRITFGRYTSQTPVPGSFEKRREKWNEARIALEDQWRRILESAAKNELKDEDVQYHFPCMDTDSAECWDRFSMQRNAPDLLITNFSMLNVMLMRRREDGMFDQTRHWLEGDPWRSGNDVAPTRYFHLVVDELHSYRGTAGGEVSLLLRLLLDRLGLSPNSPQLRFLASSASLTDDAATRSFITSFLGTDSSEKDDFLHRFSLIQDPPRQKGIKSPDLRGKMEMFEEIAATSSLSTVNRSSSSSEEADGMTALKDELPLMREIAEDFNSLSGVYTVADLAGRWFGDSENAAAAAGVLTALNSLRDSGRTGAPMRMHVFFRTVPGLWACSNPDCGILPENYRHADRLFGKLYRRPVLTCGCGARVLDLLLCRHCGEVFLGGSKWRAEDNTLFLTHGQPDLERIPGSGWRQRRYGEYAVFWPETEKPKLIEWRPASEGLHHQWIRSAYNCFTGKIESLARQTNCWLYKIDPQGGAAGHLAPPDWEISYTGLPTRCPKCDADGHRRNREPFPPVQEHVTTVNRVNQLLADGLIRSTEPTGDGETLRKLVIFSDSRQNAAKLASGIELEHYRDLVRQCLVQHFTAATDLRRIMVKYLRSGRNGLSDREFSMWRDDPGITSEYKDAIKTWRDYRDELNEKQRRIIASLENEHSRTVFSVTQAANATRKKLLDLGVNPAGPRPSLQGDQRSGRWTRLLTSRGNDLEFLDEEYLEDSQRFLYKSIKEMSERECIYTLFAHRRKSAEALLLGRVTYNPDIAAPDLSRYGLNADQSSAAIEILIRIMGELRRLEGERYSRYYQALPTPFMNFVAEVTGINNNLQKAFSLELVEFLARHGLTTAPERVTLRFGNLYFIPAETGAPYWQCNRCNTILLRNAFQRCWNCLEPLDAATQRIVRTDNAEPDYYAYLSSDRTESYRLHCEEMTGQTDYGEARRRQRLFQDITLAKNGENIHFDGIDLLSVTTTMEAGVDIGGLESVMMANFPPQRFNYQQRVGRAGRRNSSLATALTVSRGSNHDEAHYTNPRRMLSTTPSAPYIDVERLEMQKRFLMKEVLRRTFWESKVGGENVHGSFGTVGDWASNAPLLLRWLDRNKSELSGIIDTLVRGTTVASRKQELAEWAAVGMPEAINMAVRDQPGFPGAPLSQALADCGQLPMFGLPTRMRQLHHHRPNRLPGDGIARDLDIAISQFAPKSQTIKDKSKLTAVGVVTFQEQWNRVREEDGRGVPHRFCQCPACTTLFHEPLPEGFCPVCQAPLDENAAFTAWEPLGFTVEYNFETGEGEREDDDGYFEWTPRSTPARLCMPSRPMRKVSGRNIASASLPGTVYSVNDNDGKLFRMEQLRSHRALWVHRDALNDGGDPSRPQRGFWLNDLDGNSAVDVALCSARTTDVLLLRHSDVPAFLHSNPDAPAGRVYCKAAYYSWGYMARRAAANYLDVSVDELNMNTT
ncbi:MAG: DEAD/DEAH box helicase [Planctomycetaceae bacterium]|nr:DEAD/DEAH box helicase [Planctomycetaceae bacterium]